MNIREFSFNLQKIYADMSVAFSTYQKTQSLPCPTGCGLCCLNPEVEASMLEMIPLAFKIYQDGQVDDWIYKLQSGQADAYCLQYQATGPGTGRCGAYEYRPSVCRMFGVAGTLDKYGKITHSICKILKENASLPLNANPDTPLIPTWSARLSSLDPELIKNKLPLNQALLKALEYVAFCAQYQTL